jgi:glyoxylase-like metal-dependent hydrolase (beta-lactamase superfamily II)
MAGKRMGRWKVGDVEVFSIAEVVEHEDPMAVLLENGTPEMALQFPWLLPNYITADGRMRINFQGFVVKAGGKIIIVDTCIGGDRQREYDVFCNLKSEYLNDLASIGVTPDNVDIVLCTHLHFDHVGWNAQLQDGKWVPTFPNARYLFGREEYEYWMILYRTKGYHNLDHVDECITPIVAAGLVDFVEMNHRISAEISLEPTPGHTPGHVSVRIESRGEQGIITGDLMHHPIQIALPGHTANFDMDKKVGAHNRTEFVKDAADRPVLVIGTHFCEPVAGFVKTDGDAWRFEGSPT